MRPPCGTRKKPVPAYRAVVRAMSPGLAKYLLPKSPLCRTCYKHESRPKSIGRTHIFCPRMHGNTRHDVARATPGLTRMAHRRGHSHRCGNVPNSALLPTPSPMPPSPPGLSESELRLSCDTQPTISHCWFLLKHGVLPAVRWCRFWRNSGIPGGHSSVVLRRW